MSNFREDIEQIVAQKKRGSPRVQCMRRRKVTSCEECCRYLEGCKTAYEQ